MATKEEWDSMMAEIDQLDQQLKALRRSSQDEEGTTESAKTERVELSRMAASASGKSAALPWQGQRQSVRIDPGISPGANGSEKKALPFGQPLPFEKNSRSWNASSLFLNETEEDPPEEEDLQCYLIRKKYTNIQQDGELDRMENRKPVLSSAWSDARAAGLPAGQLYLQTAKHLTEGQISEMTAQELVLLKSTGTPLTLGMRQFYSAFTLLQSSPSRQRISDTLSELGHIPEENPVDAGVMILKDAIAAVLRKQQLRSDRQDREYQGRQSEYDSRQQQAETDFDRAKHRTDRWRK